MRSQVISLSFLFIGGGTGTMMRYAVVSALRTTSRGTHFPIGTLCVNVLGCLAIGVLWQLLAGPWSVREDVRIAIVVGLLGGFTTFSSFGLEAVQMWADGHYARTILYVLLSNLLGFAAVWLGTRCVPASTGAAA
ncbi:MAG: fluoride efflux transporter CrcB [Phycisphaerales bacterium]